MQNYSPRVREANRARVVPDAAYVLYWMTAFRRAQWNHSLDRAVSWAKELAKPLLVLEALRLDYAWASDRLHGFLLQGMAANAVALRRTNIEYYPYLETARGAGKGLLAALAQRACVIITDDFPAFFIPRMIRAAARRVTVLLEQVDSNGLVPLAAAPKAFPTAYAFRRFAHGHLLDWLEDMPRRRPLAGVRLPRLEKLPPEVTRRWPRVDLTMRGNGADLITNLPVDHSIPTTDARGGSPPARRRWRQFLESGLRQYGSERNQPETDTTSGLSPYLHFGHISVHEVVDELLDHYGWSPDRVEPAARGQRSGWWGMDENAESFLDELVTWRELGFNTASHVAGYEQYESLPTWARETLDSHRSDIREHLYTPEQLEAAQTHDPLWNAAQRQLLREGRIHGYLRMLWGKKILKWSPSPEQAHATMVQLNNKYALDGRDPNSYSGISWVLGKYDRPWAPERPIFGRVRYMTSRSTARKFKVDKYIQKYS
jgi:deoxyribodipyrimidine photo-lyase